MRGHGPRHLVMKSLGLLERGAAGYQGRMQGRNIDKIIRDSEHCFDLNSPGEDLKLSSAKLLEKSLACLTTAVSMLPLPRNEAIATLWALLQSSPSFVYRIHKFQLLVQAKPINRTSTSHQYKSLLLIDELA